MCPPLSQAVCFPFLLSAVYSVLCIIDTFFPFSPLLLKSYQPHWLWSRDICSEFDPTRSMFYCLVFNTFLKILPHPSKKKKSLVPCLFQVSISVRQREMTGGGYSPSVLPVQQTGGIIRRQATEEGRVWVCLFVQMCVLACWYTGDMSRVLLTQCVAKLQVLYASEQDKRFRKWMEG